MSEAWFYLQGGQKLGPDGLPKLKELIAAGKLGPDDMVWTNGMANWAAASTVPALFAPGSLPPPMDLNAPPRIRRAPSPPSEAVTSLWAFLNSLHLNRRVVFWTALSGAATSLMPWVPGGLSGLVLFTGAYAHVALVAAAGLCLLGRRDRALAGVDQIVVAALAGVAALLCVVDLFRLSETHGPIKIRPGFGIFLTLAVAVATIILVFVVRGGRSDEDRT